MTATSLRQPELLINPERPQDAAAVDALVDRAFGPGRFTKVSERVREFAAPRHDLSFCAWEDGKLVGVVRQWLVDVGGRPVIFLGPLAVDEAARLHGAGGALVERAAQAAADAGFDTVLLVGDEPYFRRLNFAVVPHGRVTLPGPVDPRRILVRALRSGAAAELSGPVRAHPLARKLEAGPAQA